MTGDSAYAEVTEPPERHPLPWRNQPSEGENQTSIGIPLTVKKCGVLSIFRLPIFEFAASGVSLLEPHISLNSVR